MSVLKLYYDRLDDNPVAWNILPVYLISHDSLLNQLCPTLDDLEESDRPLFDTSLPFLIALNSPQHPSAFFNFLILRQLIEEIDLPVKQFDQTLMNTLTIVIIQLPVNSFPFRDGYVDLIRDALHEDTLEPRHSEEGN